MTPLEYRLTTYTESKRTLALTPSKAGCERNSDVAFFSKSVDADLAQSIDGKSPGLILQSVRAINYNKRNE